jgi:hypothetical protein
MEKRAEESFTEPERTGHAGGKPGARPAGLRAPRSGRAERGDRPVVPSQVPGQPDQFGMARVLRFQAPAGADALRVAVEVELQQHRRVLRGPARRREVEWLHKPVEHPHRRSRRHVVFHPPRRQLLLPAVCALDIVHPFFDARPRPTPENSSPLGGHTVCDVAGCIGEERGNAAPRMDSLLSRAGLQWRWAWDRCHATCRSLRLRKRSRGGSAGGARRGLRGGLLTRTWLPGPRMGESETGPTPLR